MNTSLNALSAERLTARLGELLGTEREGIVEFLLHLGEFDRRRLYLPLGYSSLFGYCTEHLRLPNGTTWRRTTAAKLLARFPVVGGYLRSGRLCLRTLCPLWKVLDEHNHVALLEQAAGCTEDQVKVLVASLAPEAAPADSIRKLPAPRQESVAVSSEATSRREVEVPRAEVKPISAELHVVRLTVGAEFLAELDQVRAALSHQLPAGKLEDVLRACFRMTLEACARRKHAATKKPKAAPAPSVEPGRGHKPAAVRRKVWARDDGRCTFVGAGGKRCGSTHQLEYHHIDPEGRGGLATVENLTLYCHAHNQYQAREDFGDDYMAQFDGRQATLCDASLTDCVVSVRQTLATPTTTNQPGHP